MVGALGDGGDPEAPGYCRSEAAKEFLKTYEIGEPSKGAELKATDKRTMEDALTKSFGEGGFETEIQNCAQFGTDDESRKKVLSAQTSDSTLRAVERLLSKNSTGFLLHAAAALKQQGSHMIRDIGEKPAADCVVMFAKKIFGSPKVTIQVYLHSATDKPTLARRLLQKDVRDDPVVWILRQLFRRQVFSAFREKSCYTEYFLGRAPQHVTREILESHRVATSSTAEWTSPFADKLSRCLPSPAAKRVVGVTAAKLTELYGMSVTAEKIHAAAVCSEDPTQIPRSCEMPSADPAGKDRTAILAEKVSSADVVFDRLQREIDLANREALDLRELLVGDAQQKRKSESWLRSFLDAADAGKRAWDAYLQAGAPCVYEVARPRMPEADTQMFTEIDQSAISSSHWEQLCEIFGVVKDDGFTVARLATVLMGTPVKLVTRSGTYCVALDSQAQKLFEKVGTVTRPARRPASLKSPEEKICKCDLLEVRPLPPVEERRRKETEKPRAKPAAAEPAPPTTAAPEPPVAVKPPAPAVVTAPPASKPPAAPPAKEPPPAPPPVPTAPSAPPVPPAPPSPEGKPVQKAKEVTKPKEAELQARQKTLKTTKIQEKKAAEPSPEAAALLARMKEIRKAMAPGGGEEEEGEEDQWGEDTAVGSELYYLCACAFC
jgi:hypothetical protein